ncbi:ROK family protein [Flexivirga meconopsidis]|uniref:ROK family protein n=1 Tax=Flexivirga meconopsidis TaxID=2977121 RepID=UPI002240435A|nr:ROK family protein [Flexivirga meconopsidis]
MARSEIVRSSGFSKATVQNTVDRLVTRRVVEAGGAAVEIKPGPRPMLYRATPSAAFGVGVEIHRSGVAAEVLAVGNGALARVSRPAQRHPEQTDVVDAIGAACAQAGVRGADAAAVVVSVSGGVNPQTGALLSWDLPEWHDDDLVSGLGAALPVPVELENETNLWATAESELGGMAQSADFMLLTLSSETGVGGALVLDGAVRRGRVGLAGELGYLPLSPNSPRGELRSLLERDALCALATDHGHDADDIVAVVRAAAGAEHDPLLAELATRIAHALSAVLVTVDPGRFVLAGDLGLAGGDALAAAVRERLRPVFSSLRIDPPEVTVSALPDQPVRRGLAAMVQRRLREFVLQQHNPPTQAIHPNSRGRRSS